MNEKNIINVKSLKELVYDYLREQINKHNIQPGSAINMDATAKKLGISKTPLRDALIQLEMEGFVTIAPRRGIFVNELTLEDIENFYQVIGALESSALANAVEKLTDSVIQKMEVLNREMQQAIERDNFSLFYKKNLKFHNFFIDLSKNDHLIRIVNNLKKRLYDFPPQKIWIKEWELSSVKEHQEIVDFLKQGKFQEAGNYIHGVHWSSQVQHSFIMKYYFPGKSEAGKKE